MTREGANVARKIWQPLYRRVSRDADPHTGRVSLTMRSKKSRLSMRFRTRETKVSTGRQPANESASD